MNKWIEKKVEDIIQHLLNDEDVLESFEFSQRDLKGLIKFLKNYQSDNIETQNYLNDNRKLIIKNMKSLLLEQEKASILNKVETNKSIHDKIIEEIEDIIWDAIKYNELNQSQIYGINKHSEHKIKELIDFLKNYQSSNWEVQNYLNVNREFVIEQIELFWDIETHKMTNNVEKNRKISWKADNIIWDVLQCDKKLKEFIFKINKYEDEEIEELMELLKNYQSKYKDAQDYLDNFGREWIIDQAKALLASKYQFFLDSTSTPSEFVKFYSGVFNSWVEFKRRPVKNEDEFLTCVPFLGSQIQEIMLSTLVSWELNKKIEIDQYNQLSYIKNKELLKNIKSETCKYKKLIIEAYLTNCYKQRVLDEAKMNKYINNDIPKKVLQTLKQLNHRIIEMINKGKIIKNPSFDSNQLAVKGGDGFIIGESLIIVKVLKNNMIAKTHIHQLIFCWYLNERSERYKINSFTIFNPLYNSYWKIKVEDIKFDFSSFNDHIEYYIIYDISNQNKKWKKWLTQYKDEKSKWTH